MTTEPLLKSNLEEHYTLEQWLSLKADYIKGKASLPKLCERHGFRYVSVKNRSAKEKWDQKRQSWLKAQEARLGLNGEQAISYSSPPPQTEQSNDNNDARETQEQLDIVNKALKLAETSREIADLSKSKETLVRVLYLQKNGGNPPQHKPAKTTQKRSNYPEPEPQYSIIHEAPKPVPVPVLKPDAGLDGDGI